MSVRTIAIRSAVQAALLAFVLTLLGGSVTWHFHEVIRLAPLVPWFLTALGASLAFPLVNVVEEKARNHPASVRRDLLLAIAVVAIASAALAVAPLQARYALETTDARSVEAGLAQTQITLTRFLLRNPGGIAVHFLPALPFAIVSVGRVRSIEPIRLIPATTLVALLGAIAVHDWRHAFPSREDARGFQGIVLVLGIVLPLFGHVADRVVEVMSSSSPEEAPGP